VQNDFYGFYDNGIPRLGIPPLQMADGPIGVRTANPNVFEQKTTALPSGLALASTWDTDLASRYGDVMGDEAHRTNHNVQLGPSVDIARTPFGARAFEALGEDPLLSGTLATEEVRGIQDHDVMATIKHFDVNNQENDRDKVNVDVGERALREIYTRPFEDVVQRGKVGAAMCSFNRVNTFYACGNRQLLIEILKQDLGFRGFVMSDYSATPSTLGAANNGLDQEQPGGAQWGSQLVAAVNSGQVAIQTLDDKVRRILRAMIGLGLFDDPPTVDPIPVQEHGDQARTIAAQGTVLLKNAGNALPLNANQLRSVAVIGPDADNGLTAGGGSSLVKPTYTVSPLDAISERAPDAAVSYAPGVDPVGAGALIPGLPPIPSSVLTPAGGGSGEHGLRGEYWTNTTWSGTPQHVQTDPTAQAALGFYNFSGFNANSPKLPATPTEFNKRAPLGSISTASSCFRTPMSRRAMPTSRATPPRCRCSPASRVRCAWTTRPTRASRIHSPRAARSASAGARRREPWCSRSAMPPRSRVARTSRSSSCATTAARAGSISPTSISPTSRRSSCSRWRPPTRARSSS
jgi:beta-glucosidase